MTTDAAQRGGLVTLGDDPRITRVGEILRRFKLDELPQLFNILKGEMSLVGPRPEVPCYVEIFKEGYKKILEVPPGLTDLASLRFIEEAEILEKAEKPEVEYVQTILPEKLRLATIYLQHASFLFDFAILVQTLLKLVRVRVVLFELPEVYSHATRYGNGHGAFLRSISLQYRRPVILMLDLVLIVLANYLAFWLRFDGKIPIEAKYVFATMLPWVVLIRGITFSLFRLNEGLWRYTSIWDLQSIVSGVLSSTLVFYALVHWGFEVISYPRSVFVVDSVLLIGFLVGIRLPSRLYREHGLWAGKKRILVLGAGDAGEQIVREMKTNPSYHYDPIGFVDDDPSLVGQRIHGVKVLGTREELSTILLTEQPQEVVVAMPGINPAVLREIISGLETFKIPIKTLPNLQDLLDGKVTVSQIRHLKIEDLLSRPPVGLQPQSVQQLIKGKRILVTGAGGSIGSELCRQILEFQPHVLVLFERYENSLYSIANELADRKSSSPVYSVIGDITDAPHLYATMKKYSPDIIFHAAAHKHVPLMEINPGEALKNNVLGTRTVVEAADHSGVERLVFISTDKAVNPSSVMGATKRVAELVVQDMARRSKTRFLTVRFGNVLGSNGSVVPRFQEQIKAGGPVTVTHPAVKRYFMLISEAVHLVLQAATLGEQGATYVLEMGEQIKLVELARNLIRLSGFVPKKEIPITFIGLRPGEKLEEELVGDNEEAEPSPVPKIQQIRSKTLPNLMLVSKRIVELEQNLSLGDPGFPIQYLQQMIPNFQVLEKPNPVTPRIEPQIMDAPLP
ncbi:MAG: hypothetical protein NPIRA01_08880 [Nitrospirales bacterium]|nr:MAG: hypothetical protein NPIRA01_08880 [Nitrospirales bacterium]